ncbi:hypothetical protein OKA04_11070 [Luteolibacter flavescens]|uniref:Uncharacterized protein n=1 Tax=Luteolibacter flavescens TaxID=1859460 RepID=A0ABT3FNX6_9BACT|nr:hypothetical protein [Luteolibacter flavescens]MCW1885271.1 hypothetical protein [Luteolibacter flavescens]
MRKAPSAFSGFAHLMMKIRTILLLGWLAGLVTAAGQEKEAESSSPPVGSLGEKMPEGGKPLRIRIETWEAPALEITRRLDDVRDAAALAKLRAEWLAGAPGVTLINSPVLAIDASKRELMESITERIYPTEYEPPSLGGHGAMQERKEPPENWVEVIERMLTDVVPTSFETRNTGITLEVAVDPVKGEEKIWNVAVNLEDVQLVGKDVYANAPADVAMPVFATFRSTGGARLEEGKWRLLGAQEPPRGMEGKSSDKRWVTLVRIDADE